MVEAQTPHDTPGTLTIPMGNYLSGQVVNYVIVTPSDLVIFMIVDTTGARLRQTSAAYPMAPNATTAIAGTELVARARQSHHPARSSRQSMSASAAS